MRASSGLHVNDTALGGKLGLLAGGRGREGNADFQLAAEFERVACGKRHTAPTEIYAGSMLLKRQTQAVNATNQQRDIYRDSACPSALQGRGRSAGKAHPFPPSFFWGLPLLPPRRDQGKQVQPPETMGYWSLQLPFCRRMCQLDPKSPPSCGRCARFGVTPLRFSRRA